MLPSLTSLRSFVAYQFAVLRMRAWRARLWKRITGRPTELIVFPGDHGRVARHRKLLGTQTIRLADIVGSLSREADFDSQFRPLKLIETCRPLRCVQQRIAKTKVYVTG